MVVQPLAWQPLGVLVWPTVELSITPALVAGIQVPRWSYYTRRWRSSVGDVVVCSQWIRKLLLLFQWAGRNEMENMLAAAG